MNSNRNRPGRSGGQAAGVVARLGGLLRLELSRNVRDLRYLVLAVMAPVGFYLLFAGIFSGQGRPASGLPAQIEIMVAMAVFGGMWGALSATAPRLARDRSTGWLQALRLTPFRPAEVMLARVLGAMLVVLPALVCVGATAAAVHGVRLTAGQWLATLGLLWAGSLPFVALGIAIGATASAASAYALTTGLYFAFAALGGLWVPPAQFPAALRQVAMALPSYEAADLGWRVTGGFAPEIGDVLALLGWTVGLTGLAVVLSRPRRRLASPAGALADDQAAVWMHSVSASYGPVRALDRLDLQVGQGEVVALLGPNGAGKTTAIAVMLGLRQPDQGTVRLFGGNPVASSADGRVGAMLQNGQLMDGVLVGTLVSVVRQAYPAPPDFGQLVQAADIAGMLRRRTDRLSAGQAQRVRFAIAAAGDPDLLVLDEPTAAMDVEAREAFWAAVKSHAAHGRAVLFSTHYLEEADLHADRIVVLRSGRVAADGTSEAIKAAAGTGRSVRFRTDGLDHARLRSLPGVIGIDAQAGHVCLQTTDPDATVWSLYDLRHDVHELEITSDSLQQAFLALTRSSDSALP
jgi:ABC-2 type transport system ATP-binding protein